MTCYPGLQTYDRHPATNSPGALLPGSPASHLSPSSYGPGPLALGCLPKGPQGNVAPTFPINPCLYLPPTPILSQRAPQSTLPFIQPKLPLETAAIFLILPTILVRNRLGDHYSAYLSLAVPTACPNRNQRVCSKIYSPKDPASRSCNIRPLLPSKTYHTIKVGGP